MNRAGPVGAPLVALIAALGIALPSPAMAMAQHKEHQHQSLPADAIGDESIYQLESIWLDQRGATRALGALGGAPVVAAMIYTSCEFACPLIVRDMLAIYHHLDASERGATRFVLFSFDPRRDTPNAMRRYAADQHLPAPDWTLLAADDDASLELAVALGVRYKPLAGGDFAHSNAVFVLACDGTPMHRQERLGNAPEHAASVVRAALLACAKTP
ncbi:MAG: SCO family protein [bacterium]